MMASLIAFFKVPFAMTERSKFIRDAMARKDWDDENGPVYKGWKLWCWTGWKGNWAKAADTIYTADWNRMCCTRCGKRVHPEDDVYLSQALRGIWHFSCSDETHKFLVGQWCALKGERPNELFVESCVPGHVESYEEGAAFDITDAQWIGPYTSEFVKERERRLGLERLCDWIDDHDLSLKVR